MSQTCFFIICYCFVVTLMCLFLCDTLFQSDFLPHNWYILDCLCFTQHLHYDSIVSIAMSSVWVHFINFICLLFSFIFHRTFLFLLFQPSATYTQTTQTTQMAINYTSSPPLVTSSRRASRTKPVTSDDILLLLGGLF